MPILEVLTIIGCILVNLYPSTPHAVEEPVRPHTGATVAFATQLAIAKFELMAEKTYGDAWTYASRLSAIEAEVSAGLDDTLNRALDALGIDPRARLAMLGT